MGLALPRSNLDGRLAQLEAAKSQDDLQPLIEELRDDLGVDHIVYHWVAADGEQFGCGTYDPVWVQRYLDKGYLRVDPVIMGCYQRFHPVDWKRLDWTSKAARNFLQDAVAHGVGNQGYSVPIRGPNGQFALFSLSHSCDDEAWSDFTESHRRELILIAHYFNQKALEFQPGRGPKPTTALSPREVDAMTLIAVGLSLREVSRDGGQADADTELL